MTSPFDVVRLLRFCDAERNSREQQQHHTHTHTERRCIHLRLSLLSSGKDETMARRRDDDEEDDGHKLIEEEEEEDAHPIMDREDEDELSLDEILHLYKQPINEEQAWAVCYQCCRSFLENKDGSSGSAGTGGPGDVRIYKDGAVRLRLHSGDRSGDKSFNTFCIHYIHRHVHLYT